MLLPRSYRTQLFGQTALSQRFCGAPSIAEFIEPSRVKRDVSVQPHVKARLCDSVEPEISAEMREASSHLTASLRP